MIRNAVLAVLAAFVAISGFANNNPGPGLTDVFRGLSAFEWVMLAIGVILLAAVAGVSWLLVHLLGQNGRLLVRIDRIEAALEDADIEIPDDDEDDEEDEEEEDEGLPFGAPAPAFSLSGLYGETMTLDALRATEKPVLLLFTDPTCGPCNAMMGDVGKWQRDLSEKLTIAVITRGSLEDNRNKAKQNNLTHVLMQKSNEVADAYETYGTPTAVLVRPDGTIGSAAAGGADEIRTLVKQASEGKVPVPRPRLAAVPRPAQPANAQAPRGIASIGKDAPVVELNNLDGETVKLADFAGHPTAVLFWNPGCGFCQRMVDDLKAWESDRPEGAPNLLVVSTGEVERNREQGFSSPVVLDSGFTVGRAFGASGTPSAVLVGADGKIASGLAVGGPTVISLLRNEAPNLLDASAAEEPEAPAAPRGVPVGGKAPNVQVAGSRRERGQPRGDSQRADGAPVLEPGLRVLPAARRRHQGLGERAPRGRPAARPDLDRRTGSEPRAWLRVDHSAGPGFPHRRSVRRLRDTVRDPDRRRRQRRLRSVGRRPRCHEPPSFVVWTARVSRTGRPHWPPRCCAPFAKDPICFPAAVADRVRRAR